MKKILVILMLCFVICGCGKVTSNKDLIKKMNDDEYIIIDVRTNDEYKESHIVGAINIPYDEINKRTKIDKNKTIFVYCKSGKRSKVAYDKLLELGYKVYDLGSFFEIDLPME